MKRRTLLLGSGSVAVLSVAGCLGTETNEPADAFDGTDASTEEMDDSADTSDDMNDRSSGTKIDPDAHYVVRGPEGLFSARGPWNTDLEGVVIHGYDLVEYFQAERPVRGSENYEIEYDGVRFWFSSEQNRTTFADDPNAYLPEFGGYCSLGVGNGYKDGMHSEAFDILDGKLYFNLTPAIHAGWLRNYEERIATAEQNWPEIKDSTDSIHIGPGLPG